MTAKDIGLIEKYKVERTDGKSVGECVVLQFDDEYARPALRVWADTMRANDWEVLADDVEAKLDTYGPEDALGVIHAAYNEGYVQGQADAGNKILL